ncbi:hypothetical protein I3760_08G024900 [Carya illinoinensis]|nr:hypothetical protein I3760_08G024900 [Carya illinoinensis]KAG2691830.1 hypothetical protein I3760_08G024900 [Carya illinoinensis]KAG2691831.1 hypothetical protein I3760_08G024900 [Carya illinoinensis]
MEIRGIVEEKNPCKNNSNIVSKSERSFIQIDSISIDLVSAKDNSDAEKCEHFSIRGYVSKVRKKYWKICCPFYLEVDRTESEEETSFLPPLDAPKFRWWRCQSCLSEFAAKDCGTLFNCCSTQCGSSSGCLHVGSAAVFLPGFQKTPNPVLSETSADAKTSTKLNDDNRLLFCNDKKENNVEVAQNTFIGRFDIDSEQNHNQELPKFTSAANEINSSMIQERHANDTVAFKSKSNGSVEFDEPGSGSHGTADGNLKCRVKNSVEHYQIGMQTSPNDQHTDLTKAPCQTLGYLGSMVDEEPNAVNPPTTGNHSDQDLDHDSDYKDCESVEIMVGNDLLDHPSDKSCYLHRRKSRKVRLLTELLGENGDAKSDPIETDNSPFNKSRPDAFGGLDTLYVTRGQVAIQENVKRDSSQTRKRKLLQDEEWKPPEMASRNNLKIKAKAWKRDAETTDAIVGNEFQDAIAGIDLKNDMKSHQNKGMNDRSPTTGKKKNKKIQVDDACFSLAPQPLNVQKAIQEKIEILSKSNASDGTVSFRFDHNPFKGKRINPFHFPALRMERKRNMCQKRNKNLKAYGGQAALFPWTKEVLKNYTITRKSVDIIQTGSATNSFQSAQDSSTGKGLCLSLDSFLDVQGHDKEFISQVEDGRPSFLPWQEVNPKVDQLMRENIEITNFGHPRVPSKSPPAPFSGKVVIDEVSNKKTTSRMPLPNNIQNCLSQVEDRKCSRTHQRIFSGPSNINKALKAKEHPVVEEKHSDGKVGKVSEQGPLDDVTMEVVELMAKNQYERCLPDAENKKGFLETTPNTRNGWMMGCTNIYGNGELRLLQKDNTHKQKFQTRNGRNGLIIKGQKLGPSKQKSVDYSSHIDRNSLNVSHLHQTETPTVFGTCVQSQKKPSSGVQFSATDSSRHISGQNCNWNGGTVGHAPSHEILLALGGYDTRQTVPQQSEAAVHLWPTMVPNQMMPFGCSMPQSGLSPNNKGILSKYYNSLQKGNRDLKFFNINATSLDEKHNMSHGSETLSTPNAECPFAFKHNGIELPPSLMGPSDLYSNEAIPAMHLLSLMDAGMQSSPTFNMGGTPKLPGRPSFTHDRKSKEFQRMEIISSYKSMDSKKRPSSQYHGKTHFSEKSHGCFHCIPTVDASVSSFQCDKAFRRATNFTGQVTLKFQEKEKARSSSSPTQARDGRSEKFVFPTGSSGTNHGSIPVRRVQKKFLGASDSSVLTLQYNGVLKNSTQHPKSNTVSELCSVNRNPAEFSMPGVGSTYMIRGEELKFGKVTDPSQTRYGLIQLNGRKRHRNLKRAIVKEHVQHCL